MSLFTVGCPCEQIHMKLFTFGNPKWRNSYMTWFTCGVFQVKKLIWSGSLLACPKFRNLNDVVHFLRPKSRNSYMNRLTLGSKATKAMVHFWDVTHNLNLFEMIHGCLITWPMFPQGSSTSAINGMQFWSKMHFSPWTFFVPPIGQERFFPRASERRVLPIVGVCKTSSHLHIFSSSHLLIFTSSHRHGDVSATKDTRCCSFPYRHGDVSAAKDTRSCSFPYKHRINDAKNDAPTNWRRTRVQPPNTQTINGNPLLRIREINNLYIYIYATSCCIIIWWWDHVWYCLIRSPWSFMIHVEWSHHFRTGNEKHEDEH